MTLCVCFAIFEFPNKSPEASRIIGDLYIGTIFPLIEQLGDSTACKQTRTCDGPSLSKTYT